MVIIKRKIQFSPDPDAGGKVEDRDYSKFSEGFLDDDDIAVESKSEKKEEEESEKRNTEDDQKRNTDSDEEEKSEGKKSEEGKSEEEEEKKEEEESEEKEEEKKKEDEKDDDEKPKEKSEEEEEGKEEKSEEEEIDELFDLEQKEEEDSPGQKEKEFDYQSFASELDIEIEENDPEQFKEAFNKKLEEAKQEFKLDTLNKEAQKVVKYFTENDGSFADFFVDDKIAFIDKALANDNETLYRSVREELLMNQGYSKKEAEEAIEDEMMDDEQYNREVKRFRVGLINSRNQRIAEMVNEKEANASEIKQKSEEIMQKQVSELKKEVENIDTFYGIKIPEKTKKAIIQQIDSGEFDKVVNTNPAKAKVYAFLEAKNGEKVRKHLEEKIKESGRKGYSKAAETYARDLTNTPPKGHKNSHAKAHEGDQRRFGAWADVDKD